ncbi:MAG: TA system VapC family ribonuclease toxin [Actinomycetales bacterium]
MSEDADWLCDVNVLLALALSTHVHHRAAHAALHKHTGRWATCPLTEASLFRLLLNPRVTGTEFTATAVRQALRGMRSHPRWRWLSDDSSLADPDITTAVLVGHQQVTDFHLVNLAARHGLALATFDGAISPALAPADRHHVHVVAP